MANKLSGDNDFEKLGDLCKRTYKAQAVWYLNAFWEDGAQDCAERLWEYVHKCEELDLEKHEEGHGLDEMKAHVFLESFQETLTVRELRNNLRSTGAIGEKERPKLVPLVHYLLFKYGADWHTLVNAAQGDNKEELAEAQRLLDACTAAFVESEARASDARKALNEARSSEAAAVAREAEAKAAEQEAKDAEAAARASEAEAKAREADAKAAEAEAKSREAEAVEAEAPFKAATEELQAALADVKAQEDEYHGKIEDCKRRAETGGVVSRNKAKNELAQLEGEDPLPLRRAKITLEAAKKKADKARAPFEAATQVAVEARAAAEAAAAAASEAAAAASASADAASAAREAAEASANAASEARASAEAARVASEEAAQVAADALAAAEQSLQEAQAYLEEVKAKPGVAYGAIWWMERELYEQKKFLPESKGGIRR